MKVGIIGASGYTGAELMRLLCQHPSVEVAYITAHTYAGKRVEELYPHLQVYREMRFQAFRPEEALQEAEFHFVALPHGEAMEVVPPLLEGGARVVDLSADYRLADPQEYARWYGKEHRSPDLLPSAVYGLPEFYASDLRDARLVAVPGCYPTAALLALGPLAMRGYPLDGCIIDAKSGLSGAGRTLSLTSHFAQADESVKPYGVGSHRHTPEIEGRLSELSSRPVRVSFVPHLVPMSRGILATCYLPLGQEVTSREVSEAYEGFYAGSPFVVLLGEGRFPETKCVAGSNYCHLGWHLDRERRVLVVASAIDNLVKGASGQAVQCMNIMMGWEESLGLEAPGVFP
ncbi:N-acetyl-gamma-glutamyl-phosphate reductase [Candidatus Solincola tengchongensis]|uniref:N-acetyl-gamma-glutamyl-phosphate reductase n=1 Tax=Candidatus Solincola tengchongensis TaxID=2900693 RepID=UPI00257BAB2A|nr:N-acetyl-gamma-glutamyl-phosphate reductase [Candidatus Solincola tengchongensis]